MYIQFVSEGQVDTVQFAMFHRLEVQPLPVLVWAHRKYFSFQCHKVVSSRLVYYSILNSFGKRSQYISIKFALHKQSENPWMCYYLRQSTARDFTVCGFIPNSHNKSWMVFIATRAEVGKVLWYLSGLQMAFSSVFLRLRLSKSLLSMLWKFINKKLAEIWIKFVQC